MIHITGDLHAEVDFKKLLNPMWSSTMNKEDFLIILGDFGLPFQDTDIQANGSPAEGPYKECITWMSQRPFQILWIDGNHDNHRFWAKQETTEWHGGMVHFHPHAKNVIHLMRGEVYDIEDKKFFSFGGAPSHDRYNRTEGIDWWPEEEASAEEMERALLNLERYGNHVDYVLTHTLPTKVIQKRFFCDGDSQTEQFLQAVKDKLEYDMWFAGHFHKNNLFPDEKTYVLYDCIYSIEKCRKQLSDYNKMLQSGFYKNCGKQFER